MKRLALQLNHAGYGSIEFWLSKPLSSLPEYLELVNELATEERKALERARKKR